MTSRRKKHVTAVRLAMGTNATEEDALVVLKKEKKLRKAAKPRTPR